MTNIVYYTKECLICIDQSPKFPPDVLKEMHCGKWRYPVRFEAPFPRRIDTLIIVTEVTPTAFPDIHRPSPLKIHIWEQVALGFTNKQIAHEVFSSESTVKHHISSLMRDFGCTNRTELGNLYWDWLRQECGSKS